MKVWQYNKCCATCDYWTGNRQVEGWGQASAAIVDINSRGKCYSRTWHGTVERAYSNVCNDYKKWGSLE